MEKGRIYLNDNATGIAMMILGIIWFFSVMILEIIFPSDLSSMSNFTAIIVSIITLILMLYIPYWFISRGWNIISRHKYLVRKN